MKWSVVIETKVTGLLQDFPFSRCERNIWEGTTLWAGIENYSSKHWLTKIHCDAGVLGLFNNIITVTNISLTSNCYGFQQDCRYTVNIIIGRNRNISVITKYVKKFISSIKFRKINFSRILLKMSRKNISTKISGKAIKQQYDLIIYLWFHYWNTNVSGFQLQHYFHNKKDYLPWLLVSIY